MGRAAKGCQVAVTLTTRSGRSGRVRSGDAGDGVASESQKPRQRVSNADRKVFANPESFCDKFIIG